MRTPCALRLYRAQLNSSKLIDMKLANRIAIVADALNSDPRAAAAHSHQLGFSGLQFDAFGSAKLTELSQTGLRDFRHTLSSHNQAFVGSRVDFGIAGIMPGADVDRILHQLEKVFEANRPLGSSLVCAEIGPLPEPVISPVVKQRISQAQAGLLLLPDPTSLAESVEPVNPIDPAVQQKFDTASSFVASALAAIGELADRYQIALAVRAELASYAAIAHALESARCPWLGIDLDPVALLRDQWPVDEIFAKLATKILHVRARDAQSNSSHRTKPAIIGTGHTRWPALLHLLDDASYQSYLTIDPIDLPHRPTAAIAGLAALNKLI